MTLGDIINSYRTKNKMSMKTFSELSGISKAYISLLEKNRHPKTGKPIIPSIQVIKQAANAMNMDFNELFGLIDSDMPLAKTLSISPAVITEWNVSEASHNEKPQKIFQRNLLKYLSLSGKSQKDVAEAIGVSPQTFNTWCQGIAIPRIGKIQLLADYFHISKSELLDEKTIKGNKEISQILANTEELLRQDGIMLDGKPVSEEDFNKIFSQRLRYYLNKSGITQADLAAKLGVGTTSVYNWCNAIKTPRMNKIDAMCVLFDCKRSDLMENKTGQEYSSYYADSSTQELAKFLKDNPEHRVLFDAARKVKAKDIEIVKSILDKFGE